MDHLLGGSQKPSEVFHAQIAKSIDDLRLFALDVVEVVAAQIGLRVNRLSPLGRLSDDILVLILLHLDNRDTFFAAKVSMRWRTLSLSTPSLWAAIDLSCRPVEFERRFLRFLGRSQNAPMDLKLVMQSNEVDTTGVCMKDGGDVYSLRRDRCVADVSQQLGHNVQNIAMASDVLTRLRTLDITSLISTDPTNCGYGDTLTRQPTQTLHLAASPSLRRLRLNWAKIRVHELRLNLASNHGAYDSVNSLALNGIVNLQEVLTRFPRVTDLSLWLGQHESPSPDIQLGDICEWMPQLHKMEVGDVPQDFALKPLTSMLRLNRLALHDTFACDVLMRVAGQMELNAISGIYLWNKMPNSFVLGFIHALNGPAAELSVYASYWPWRWKDPNYEFCAEDGHGRSRIFHSTHYNSEYSEEIAGYATVNTDMVALDGVLPEVMPQLTTLRVREPIGSFRTHDSKVTPLSCPALAHIELYVVHERKLDEEEGVLSGTDVLNWISHHLKDFAQPLNTLRVVGVRVGSDLGALDGLASNILFSPSSLVEKRTWPHSPLAANLFEELNIGPVI